MIHVFFFKDVMDESAYTCTCVNMGVSKLPAYRKLTEFVVEAS